MDGPSSDDLLESAMAAVDDGDFEPHHHHQHEDDPSLDMQPLKRQRQEQDVVFLSDLDGLNATLTNLTNPTTDPTTHQHPLISLDSAGFVDPDETAAVADAFLTEIGSAVPQDPTIRAPKRRRGGSDRLVSRARVNAAKTPADLLTAVLELYDEFARADKKTLEEADRQFYLRTVPIATCFLEHWGGRREAFLERVGKMTVNSFGKRCRGKKHTLCGLMVETGGTPSVVVVGEGDVGAAAAAAAANPATPTPGRKTTAAAAVTQRPETQAPLTVTLLPTTFSLCQIPPSALTDPATATEATNFLTAQLAGLATAAGDGDGARAEYPHDLVSFTRTPREISLVLPSSLVMPGATDFSSLEAALHSSSSSSRNDGSASHLAPPEDGGGSSGGAGYPSWLMVEAGWRFFRVEGPLPAYQTGVMGKLTGALADAKVSVFVVSSFDTDYVGVKHVDVAVAKQALEKKAKCRVVVGL
ncbi:hypothetical protein DFJ73DRAFT_8574 [Zopfochytrium polystomum]|nr:hypothetical protein DFJ73DRAFT_8574 [Zopfochytrium polystomum]